MAVEGKQFDEALVERLATELLASSFSHRLSDSEIEVRKLSKPQEFEGFKADVETVLTALSETHAIMPIEEYNIMRTLLQDVAERIPDPCHTHPWCNGCTPYSPTGDPPCDEKWFYDALQSYAKEAPPHA